MAEITAYDVTDTTLAGLVADARAIDLRSFSPSDPPLPIQRTGLVEVVIPDAAADAVDWA